MYIYLPSVASSTLLTPFFRMELTASTISARPPYERRRFSWYFLFFEPTQSIGSDVVQADAAGNVIDLQILGIVNILLTIYLGSFAVIIIPCYIWLAKVSSGVMRKRSIYQVIGYAIFVVCGFIDTRLQVLPGIMVVVRIIMASAYIFMFIGFSE